MIVIGDLLGVEPEDRDLLLRWSDDMICGLSASAAPELLQRASDAFFEYADYHRRVVADRRLGRKTTSSASCCTRRSTASA
jgi:cytochrome P450 family 142 subfamily A polypeptide 1